MIPVSASSSFRIPFLENLARRIRAKRLIESAASLCDFPEPLLIQSALDGLPACVSDEIRSAVFGAKRNQRTLPGTYSHRENAHAEARGPLRSGNPIRIQFLAIGENVSGHGSAPLPCQRPARQCESLPQCLFRPWG